MLQNLYPSKLKQSGAIKFNFISHYLLKYANNAEPPIINIRATIFIKVTLSPIKKPMIDARAMLPPIIIGPPIETGRPLL